MTMDESKIYELADGEIYVWVDPGGAICLKVRNEFNDPVELTEPQAMDIATVLNRLARELSAAAGDEE